MSEKSDEEFLKHITTFNQVIADLRDSCIKMYNGQKQAEAKIEKVRKVVNFHIASEDNRISFIENMSETSQRSTINATKRQEAMCRKIPFNVILTLLNSEPESEEGNEKNT